MNHIIPYITMNNKIIYGIQQMGVGVDDAEKGFKWYGTLLGADVAVFEDSNTATHMAPYMGGQPHDKKAILAVNLQGGSGYEIWQYLDRNPQKSAHPFSLGDLGLNIAMVKSRDIQKSFDRLHASEVPVLTDIHPQPDGVPAFFIQDPWDNILQIKASDNWYMNTGCDVGGVFGCIIGVSDIDHARKLYSDVLGYDKVVYDETGEFESLKGLPNGDVKFRRVLLTHSASRSGGFSNLFGTSQLELMQWVDGTPKKLFENRYWGDIGFIHLCFDVHNMKALIEECKAAGFPFKVLSEESFDMGDANGFWGYIEDPDGTLIEFVETHKVPILKKLNLNIDLRKRDPQKPLPNWMIKAMAFKRKKF